MRNLILLLLTLFLPVLLLAQCAGISNLDPQTKPNGLDYYYVLDSDGVFTTIPSLTEVATPYALFRDTILPTISANAESYFASEYEVDFTSFSDGETSDDGYWQLASIVLPKEYSLKVIYSGDETVPAAGWTVYQALHRIIATQHPTEITGGGAWVTDRIGISSANRTILYGSPVNTLGIPVYSAIDYGVFRVYCSDGIITNPFDIHYRNVKPIFFDTLAGSINAFTGSLKYLSDRVPVDYEVSLDGGATWTGTANGRVELENNSGTLSALARIFFRFNP